MRFRHILLRAGLLALMALPRVVAAETVVTPDQLRSAAAQALMAGDAPRALDFSNALIRRDASDFNALLIRTRALRDMGRSGEALRAAWTSLRAAQTPMQDYAAALVMARVQSSAGRKTIGQYWLRRAVELAPTEVDRARAIRDFKYLRATNPWATRLSFSITPDSNINDGSANDSSVLNYRQAELLFGRPVEYQLSAAAQAVPGIRYTLGLDTRYRVSQTERSAHDLFFKGDARHYSLSEETRRTTPGVRGEDFAFASVFLGYGYRWLGDSGRTETALRTDLGHSWYGGSEYAQYLRAAIHHSRKLSSEAKLGASLRTERQFGIRAPDIDTANLNLWGSHRLVAGHMFNWTVGGGMAQSPLVTEEFQELRAYTSLVLAKPILGASAQLGVGLRQRDYDVSLHSPQGRHDTELRGDLTLVFRQVDYHGFNPTLTLYGAQKSSNIALYESNKLGVNFGIQSAF